MSAAGTPDAPPLHGLALSGGFSRRMGRDKGLLDYAGVPAVRRAWLTLNAVCVETVVSIRPDQTEAYESLDLPLIVDSREAEGPLAGLLAAWEAGETRAWLALAVDLPRVDPELLTELVRARDPAKLATAFVHPDGTLEPLCTIWEPCAHPRLRERAHAGRFSLRRVLEAESIATVRPSAPERLASVNTPERYAEVARILD